MLYPPVRVVDLHRPPVVPPPDGRSRALERAVDWAARAPSVHHTRPWRIEWHSDRLVIRADPSRQARVDPRGRELARSVGASVFNARVALAAQGWAAEVDRLPDAGDPDLIAELRPLAGPPDAALARLGPALLRRRTRGRRYTGGTVPGELLRRLIDIADREGAILVPIEHESSRRLVARLTQQADLPADAEPAGQGPTGDETLVLLATPTDDRSAWLRAGEALQHVSLELARLAWVAGPVPQVIEVPLVRVQLRAALAWYAHPQMLVRIGHAPRTASTPQRSRGDVVVDRRHPAG
jgi:hypothetical protein